MIKNLRLHLLLLIMVLLYSACKKEKNPSKNSDTNNYSNIAPYHLNMPDSADNFPIVNASLSVQETTTGPAVPNDFLGFSFEKQIMTDPTYFNASNISFINMFKNLDNGVIRIGGTTVDETFYSPNTRTAAYTDTVFASDVDRYKAFAAAVGWKTIWGLNLGTGTADNDAAEAQYVSHSIPSLIESFAIGNEPAYYFSDGWRPGSYTLNSYADEFVNFSGVVKKDAPSAVFSGPENEVSAIGPTFMQMYGSHVNLLTVHYYRMGPAGSQSVTMDQLLSFDPSLQGLVEQAGPDAQSQNIPYRVTECNSVYGGGEQNMSNAYAASLWGSEFLFYLAQQGAAGINFHTGGTPNYVYSPISTVNGTSVARPLYYAMLLFHQANISQFTDNDLTNNTHLNMDAYSFITKDYKTGIMLINKDLVNDLSITISTNSLIQTATAYELNGPALTSLTGTNINGTMVNDDGTFVVNGQQFSLNKKYASVLVKVQRTSAMLIILN